MKEFINVTDITDDYFEEFTKAYLMKTRYPVFTRVMLIIGFFLGLVFLVTHYASWYIAIGLISIVLPVVAGITYMSLKKRMIQVNKDRLKSMNIDYSGKSEKITITDASIKATALSGKELNLPLKSIKNHFESRNYFILIFDTGSLLCLSKTGFEEGTAQEFATFISTFPKKKPWLGIIIGIGATVIDCIDLYLMFFIFAAVLFM